MRPAGFTSLPLFCLSDAEVAATGLRRGVRRESGSAARCADNIGRGMFQRRLDRRHFEKLGIPRRDMTRYLSGKVLPSVERLVLIAGELGVKRPVLLVEGELFLEHVTAEAAPSEIWLREALVELRQLDDPASALKLLRALSKRRANAAS